MLVIAVGLMFSMTVQDLGIGQLDLGIGQVLQAFQISPKRFSRKEVLVMTVRGIESSSANLFIIFCGGSKGPGDLLL
jgi:hypothetical protein